MKPVIDLNSKSRADAKNEFEKDLHKHMNTAIFGKTMEHFELHMEYDLVANKREQSNYYLHHIINTIIYTMKRWSVCYNVLDSQF